MKGVFIINSQKFKRKIVLDTSVIMCEEDILFEFPDTEILIPIIVWEELNDLKENLNKGYVPRKTLRLLKSLSEIRPLREGVNLNELDNRNENTLIKIIYLTNESTNKSSYNPHNIFKYDKNDYDIISFAAEHPEATLVSMDIGLLSIAADFVKVEEFIYDKQLNKEYKGYREVVVSDILVNKLYNDKEIEDEWDLYPNEFIILTSACNPKHQGVGIKKNNKIKLCNFQNNLYLGMKTKPKNLEQKMFLHLLADPDIKAVTVTGVSGRGKSLLTIDYALSQVKSDMFYNFLYTKSITPVDENEYLGFYKGGVDEKLEPHLQPLFSSIEYLYKDSIYDKNKSSEERITTDSIYQNLKATDAISVIPLSDIRGMNINNKIVMLDEAQNTHRHMIKALVSRLTDESKIVVAGDIEQIDNNKLSMFNNGLSHLIEQGKEEECVAHITLDIDKTGSARGKLATFASNKL